MKGKSFSRVIIRGISSAVPVRHILTDEYRQHFGDKDIERFKQATGIEGRYISNGKQTASDLCYVAAETLLREKDISGDIDALIFVTQTADYRTPATAFVLQKRLGLKKDCLVFDMNMGCSAFVVSIYTVAGMIESGMINNALVLIGDSKLEHPITEDHSESMMFGDAGAAIVLSKGTLSSMNGMIRSDGDGYKAIIAPFCGSRVPFKYLGEAYTNSNEIMDGNTVFTFSITKVPKLFNEFYSYFEVSEKVFDYYLLHQANKMILDKLIKKLKIPKEKVPVSLDRYGNTNGVSIPLTLCDSFGNENGDRKLSVIASGFGVGLSWGVLSFHINIADILPVIHTDDFFAEGFEI